jgi:DNA-binding NtrC family response regulator
MREKILVVDDDADARDAFLNALVASGYAVASARSADEAWSIIVDAHPDLVVTDIHMPGIHGVHLAQSIRQLPSPIPVVLVTGGETKNLVTESDLYGAVACLKKPMQLDSLIWTIEKALACKNEPAAVRPPS